MSIMQIPEIRPRRRKPKPIECPQSSPLLHIMCGLRGMHSMRFADTLTPDSRKRPFGATELQLFVAITDRHNAPLSEARFHSKVTRNPFAVEFADADDGKIATYYGRWASHRGEFGPWSLATSMRIAT